MSFDSVPTETVARNKETIEKVLILIRGDPKK